MVVLGLVCPLDFRYGRPPMKDLFTEEARLSYLLRVEAALAAAHAAVGNIPKAAADEIARKATLKHVKVARVKEIEAETRHDLMAVVRALAEQCGGDAGGHVHLGATSYDAIDTGVALQLKDALRLLRQSLVRLLRALLALSRRHKQTIMLGRTHGQAAVPTTFGYKMAVFAAEVGRHVERLDQALPRICAGKMSGAVGTSAGFGPHAAQIEEHVMAALDLVAEEAATQIVGRDRYVELFAVLANIATSMEKFATEVRNLQRTEISEVAEPFDERRQVGSSTMAQKKNPVVSEQVSGLARLVRANLGPAMENAIQWHERDLANSSAERFIVPHGLILADWIVAKMADVFEGLRVDAVRMRHNLEATQGQVMSESLLLALSGKGMSRQAAHELVRKLAFASQKNGRSLAEAAASDARVRKFLKPAEVKKALDARRYLGRAPQRVDDVVQRLSKRLR